MRKSLLAALLISSLLACNPGTPTGTKSPPDPNTPPPVIDPGPTDPNPSDPSTPDTTAPTITLSQPESNDAAINSSILLNFSEPMKSETVTVTLEPNVNLGTGEWKSDVVIEFKPSSDFAPETAYKVNVSGKDVAGNLLAGSSTYQFKTSAVKDTTPPGTPQGLKAVAEEEQVTLSWNANSESDLKGYMIQYGTSLNNLNLKTFIAKPGSSKTITGLTGDTTYYFALIAEDRSGNKSKRSNTVNATPKAVPATKLISSTPKNGATDVGTGLEVISFTLSKGMKRDLFKVKCANFTNEKCNADLATLLGVGTWTDSDKTVTFKPTRTLEQQSKYALLLEGKDKGNRNLEPTEVSFTTANAPMPLRYTPPTSAKGIPDGAYISVVFSKPMNMDSLKTAFSGSVNSRDGTQTRPLQLSRVEAFTSSQGGFGYSFVPTEKYGDGTIVTWYVAPTAMDAGGSRLLQAVADGFRVMQRFTVTIPVDPKLTGHVTRYCLRLTGCRNNEILGGPLAGYEKQPSDVISENEYVLRGFIGFSYDNGLFPENPQFVKASLRLHNTSLEGEPFAPGNLSKLALQRVNLGSKLNADDFDTPFLPCYAGQPCSFSFYGPPDPIDGPVDVLNYFQADWTDRATRGYHSHFRLRFANNKPDTGRKVTQVVRYASNPILTIEYLTP